MSQYDDDNIEFDFFDEPETVEATQRRRLPRLEMPGGGGGGGDRPPRPPMRTPTGFVPLARLVGLIAIAIVVVIGLVFWVGSCQGKSKHDEYQAYADKVKAIAAADNKLGGDFAERAPLADAEAVRARDEAAAVRAAGAAGLHASAADPRARAAARVAPEPRQRDRAARQGALGRSATRSRARRAEEQDAADRREADGPGRSSSRRATSSGSSSTARPRRSSSRTRA